MLFCVLNCVLVNLARDAKATYHIKRMVLVNMDLVYEYMENFRDDFSDEY